MTWKRRASALALLLGACSSADEAAADPYPSADSGLSSLGEADEDEDEDADAGEGDGDGDGEQDTGPTLDLGGDTKLVCDPWLQDCPAGEKCSWEQVAGVSQTRCVPIEPDAKLPGEPCMVFGDRDSGYDDCVLGALCQHVDARNQGTCAALCGGSPARPICEGEGELCHVCPDCPSLCVPICNPLAQDCADGFACVSASGSFACQPDDQLGSGALGDPCEYAFQCQPGFTCIDGSKVPDCPAAGCCSPLCSVDQPMCPAGMSCTPWFDLDNRPLPELGICQSV
ncbi:MAG TPA: hypothetical protein VK034_21890 [Enhygromyxa sp.]|nr:hypothetical protein [Enhygromyxa sp.]